MSGRTGVLPVGFRDQEDDITKQWWYEWPDLLARRNALGLLVEDVAPLLRVDPEKYRARESGAADVGKHLVDELIAMESFISSTADALISTAPSSGTVVLQAVTDQDEFVAAYPHARTRLRPAPYPAVLQHVAVGRAAGELTRRDREVEVHRGARRADLAVRRLAVGLLKNEAADLFGINKKTYYNNERGVKPPAPSTLADLQAIDDFIVSTAPRLEVVDVDEVTVVLMLGDQRQFEESYPLARTMRSGTPYPIRVHRVAAARRAHTLEGAGRPIKIAVEE